MKIFVLIVSLFGLLAVATFGGLHIWTEIGDVEISTNGIIALIVGSVFSLALGGGLMFLVFYSSRRGHDDEVGR